MRVLNLVLAAVDVRSRCCGSGMGCRHHVLRRSSQQRHLELRHDWCDGNYDRV